MNAAITKNITSDKISEVYVSLICDKSVTNQNLAFLSYWYGKKRSQMHFQRV